jgi:hypothetical protein
MMCMKEFSRSMTISDDERKSISDLKENQGI